MIEATVIVALRSRIDAQLLKQITLSENLDPDSGETVVEITVAEDVAKKALKGTRTYGQLLPAFVVAVDTETATVVTADAQQHTLTRKDARWARAYIDVDTRGPAIGDFSTLLTVGDVVRIESISKNDQPMWRLAQLPPFRALWWPCSHRLAVSRPLSEALTSIAISIITPSNPQGNQALDSSLSFILQRSLTA